MVYTEGVIGKSTARKWFAKFKNGNFDIDNTPCSGRPSEFDKDHLKALLKEKNCQTSHELVKKINCDQKMILNHLHSIGFAKKLKVWVSHELSENNKENCLQIASQHPTCHRATHSHKQHFLYQIVTGDEKWCLYINIKQRKEWIAPGDTPKPRVKPDLHPRKTMICIWWDWEGMVHWKILKRNAKVNKELYIAQLHRVNKAIRLKRSHQQAQTILLHDNARLYVTQVIKAALQELKWESFSICRILWTLHPWITIFSTLCQTI